MPEQATSTLLSASYCEHENKQILKNKCDFPRK